VCPPVTAAASVAQRHLVDLVTRRQQVLALRTAEHNRLEHVTHPAVRRQPQRHLVAWSASWNTSTPGSPK